MNFPSSVANYQDLLEKCLKIVDEVKDIGNFYIHGSRAVNKHHSDSDLDIAFIVKNKKTLPLLKNSLKSILDTRLVGQYYLHSSHWELWTIDGKEVGMHVYDREDIESRVARLYISIKDFEEVSPWVQHNLREIHELYAEDNWLDSIKEKIIKFPKTFFDEYKQSYVDFIKDRIEWLDIRPIWKGVAEEILDTAQIYEYIIRCHYAFNPEIGFYMPGAKNYMFDSPSMTPNISVELASLLKNLNLEQTQRFINKSTHKEILIKIHKAFLAVL